MFRSFKLININIIKDIRFWLIFFFIFRLYGITNPPLEAGHNWRQCTGIMVARNFYETNSNLLYPQVDDTYGKSGVVGMEFPLLNYLMYLLSLFTGFHDWYGRLINLIITTLGVFYFYKIVKRYLHERSAFYATLVLLTSIWFSFSRKTMPDTFCISLTIIGLWFGLEYLSKGCWVRLVLFSFFSTIGVLSKINAVYLLPVLGLCFFDKTFENKRKIGLSIAFLPIIMANFYWYFYWNPFLSQKFGLWYNIGMPLKEGAQELARNSSVVFKRFYFTGLQSYLAIIALLTGLYFIVSQRNTLILLVAATLFAIFLLFMFKAGYFFHHHDYYIIPFVPVLALLAGYGLANLSNKKLAIILLTFCMIEGLLNQLHDLSIKKSEKYKISLEEFADSFSQRNNLIAVNGSGNPQELYLAHRKGWTINNTQVADVNYLKDIANQGCLYLLINRHVLIKQPQLPFRLVAQSADYCAYTLK